MTQIRRNGIKTTPKYFCRNANKTFHAKIFAGEASNHVNLTLQEIRFFFKFETKIDMTSLLNSLCRKIRNRNWNIQNKLKRSKCSRWCSERRLHHISQIGMLSFVCAACTRRSLSQNNHFINNYRQIDIQICFNLLLCLALFYIVALENWAGAEISI